MSRLTRGSSQADGAVNPASGSGKDRHVGARLNFRAIEGEGGFVPLPAIEQAEAEDEQQAAAKAEMLAYESELSSWQPVTCVGEAERPPTRFVDGSVVSTTAGVCRVDGIYRPILIASLGAMEVDLDDRRLYRPPNGFKAMIAAALISNRIKTSLLDALREELSGSGIQLIALESQDFGPNYEVLRRRTWDFLKQEMEGLEREILLARPQVPTLADGLLERRLTTVEAQQQPVIGMVKRNLRQYLPDSLAAMLYELKPGQRSPAFVIKTVHAELVSWYLKLTGGSIGPGAGLVRLAMPRAYLERQFGADRRFREISGISRMLCTIRSRQESYARYRVSLEPIVRLEEQLHAVLPPIDQFAARLRLRLGRA